jgi:hypothetical protein
MIGVLGKNTSVSSDSVPTASAIERRAMCATWRPYRPKCLQVLYVLYNFETTQNTKVTKIATVHVTNLVCVQQFCTLCEEEPNIDEDSDVARGNTLW